jgi:hypothetical protein
VFVADAPKSVEETAVMAVKAVMPAPHGILSVDMTGDASGQPKVTEINAGRFTSSGVVYWHKYGPNFAEIALKAAMGEDPGVAPPLIDPMPKDMYKIMGINAGPTFVRAKDYEATLSEYRSRLARLKSKKLQPDPA